MNMTTTTIRRSNFVGRLGAAVVGVAAANLVRTHVAMASPPECCFGLNDCGQMGCSCPPSPSGGCCWTCTDTVSCRTWECCDQTCKGGCICAYLVCSCC